MNSGKTYSTISSPTTQPFDPQSRKSKSKFARTQEAQKLDKKKVDLKLTEEQRICFISPYKLRVVSQITKELQSVPYSQTSSKPSLFHQESIIQTNHCDNNINEISKMNDSLLSIYDELATQNQRKREAEIFFLRNQVQNLKLTVEEQRLQKNRAFDQLKDLQHLQRFLMERQSYICSITQKNIILNEKITKAEQQKELIQKELVYLRNTYELNLKRYQQQIAQCKNKYNVFIQENRVLQESNSQLRMQIQQFYIQNNQSTTAVESFMTQTQERAQNSRNLQLKNTNQQTVVQNSDEKDINLFLNKPQLGSQNNQIKYSLTYRDLHPSRSNNFQTSQNDNHTCDKCSNTITKLNQKIRHNQIQIDILKRMKGKAEESDNQKLKKQIKNLTQRIEFLTDKKKQQKKRLSNSPMQLSLTPMKESQQHQ